MSNKARNTAVLPSKYYVKELEDVDPRFYVEKDMIAIIPYELEEAQVPEQALIINTSIPRKTYMVTQELISIEDLHKSNTDFKKKAT